MIQSKFLYVLVKWSNIYFCFSLVSVNEEVQQAAMKELYSQRMNQNKELMIKRLQFFGKVVYPTLCIFFVITFWVMGMVHQYQTALMDQTYDYSYDMIRTF